MKEWPPVWSDPAGQRLSGEIGTLKSVIGAVASVPLCHLVIEHENRVLAGTLLFESSSLCQQVANFLKSHLKRPIAEIAALDIL